MTEPLEVHEIGRPDAVEDQVVVRFSGAALEVLERLRSEMGLATREEVVVRAVEILYGAQRRDVLYRDNGGRIEVLRVWK